MNAGKFPSVTAAKKEVGGSYYVVRNILQELEYESKVCSSNSSYNSVSGEVVNKEDNSFSVVEVVSTAVGLEDGTCTEAMDDVKTLDTNEKQLEADRLLQVCDFAGETFSKEGSHYDFVLKENNLLKGDTKSLEKQEDSKVEDAGMDNSDEFLTFPDKQKVVEASQGVQSDFRVVEGELIKEETEIGNAEGDEKEQTVSKELQNSGSPELKAEHQQQFAEEEKHARNLPTEQSDDADGLKKSSLWGNLKSFAEDGSGSGSGSGNIMAWKCETPIPLERITDCATRMLDKV